jgi:hypothetical protein
MAQKDLSKDILYQGVKTLIEADINHIHLHQPKLYTLFSLGFQTLLYRASKNPGAYLVRIEDSFLADKISRKAKDESTRKFMSRLIMPRKIRFENSMIYLDYFNLNSWSLTNEVPKDRFKCALIVKNTSSQPMIDEIDYRTMTQELPFGESFYLESLLEFIPQTMTIAFEQEFEKLKKLKFDFIGESEEAVKGVKIRENLDFDED